MHDENVIFCNLGLLRWKWLIITIFSYACNSFNNNFPCSFSYTFELGVGNTCTCVEHFYINGLFSIGQSLNPNLILGWRRFYCSKNWQILHLEKSFYNMNTENILKNILFLPWYLEGGRLRAVSLFVIYCFDFLILHEPSIPLPNNLKPCLYLMSDTPFKCYVKINISFSFL